jgi:hypothetical protein
MYKVQLRDMRIKSFRFKKQAVAYAKASGGQVLSKLDKTNLFARLLRFIKRG